MSVKPKINEFARYLPDDATGLMIRRNHKNRFAVIELDFVADPEKRSIEWVAAVKASMPPKQFAVEMMRSFETFAGKGVYDKAFFKHLHVLAAPVGPRPNYPIFRGWDFGGNQSVAICQIIGNRLYILDELPNGGTNTRDFLPNVIAFCNTHYGDDYHYIDIIDPSAMWDTNRAQADNSCAAVMREEQFGLHPVPAPSNDPGKRIDSVIELLMRICDDGKPALLINPHCRMLIQGFEGGYHYPEKATQSRRADRPVKNLFSHVHDALQYVSLRMKQHSSRGASEDEQYEASLISPTYKFSR